MSIEAAVLRAMVRMARRGEAVDEEALFARVAGSREELRATLRRLDVAGFVERRAGRPPRLTMGGLALAVALLPSRQEAVKRVTRRASRAA
jgi:hypothetical protein